MAPDPRTGVIKRPPASRATMPAAQWPTIHRTSQRDESGPDVKKLGFEEYGFSAYVKPK
jgi:hypothetical protein